MVTLNRFSPLDIFKLHTPAWTARLFTHQRGLQQLLLHQPRCVVVHPQLAHQLQGAYRTLALCHEIDRQGSNRRGSFVCQTQFPRWMQPRQSHCRLLLWVSAAYRAHPGASERRAPVFITHTCRTGAGTVTRKERAVWRAMNRQTPEIGRQTPLRVFV